MKNKLKIYLHFAFLGILMVGCKVEQKETTKGIVLANTSDIMLSDMPIIIKRKSISVKENSGKFPILMFKLDTIPAQVNDLDGDGKWDEIFMVADFNAKEKKVLDLKWSNTDPEFTVKTSVRFGKRKTKNEPVKPAIQEVLLANQVYKKLGFQKYQTDGPTWENDKVGFRHYLDGRNAKDVFGKRTPSITPEDVGINSQGAVEDNYHVMYDWGRDIFPVGNSVGLGGYALLIDNEVQRLGITTNDMLNNVEKTTFNIVSEGAVNSVLSYDYQNWKVFNNQYQVNEITSIWPGMYGYKNTVTMNGLKGDEVFLAAISNINNEVPLKVVKEGDYVCLIQHGHLTYEKQWILGTAIIVPKELYKGYIEAPKTGQLTDSYLAKLTVENGKPISYYAIAGWEMSADHNFKDASYFTNYVTNLSNQLSAKIDIEIK